MFRPHRVWVMAAVAASLPALTASAAVVTFNGQDLAAGPADARPNSDAASAAYEAAAASIGTIRRIDFEGLAPGRYANLALDSGNVTATLFNTGGDLDPEIDNVGDANEGYNTTAGGANFLHIREDVPEGEPAAGVRFDFLFPVQAIGAYLTGVGSDVGLVRVLLSDGTELFPTPQPTVGGAQFFGFVSDVPITFVEFSVQPVGGSVIDEFGVDDLAFVVVPTPDALPLAVAMMVAGVVVARWRRR